MEGENGEKAYDSRGVERGGRQVTPSLGGWVDHRGAGVMDPFLPWSEGGAAAECAGTVAEGRTTPDVCLRQ